MFKRYLLLALSILLIVPVMAQDADNIPTAAIDAALSAIEEQVGTRANSFTFQFLGDSNDSSLGCSLVQGEELPFSLNVVLVNVIYPDNTQYTVHSSISGQVVILCDAKFSAEVLAGQIDDEDACVATPVSAQPAYAAPNINVDGVFTAATEAYPIYGISSDAGWFQIASEFGLGWIEATSTTVSGDCDSVPTTSVTNPTAEGVCFITAQGGFTNVRSTPEGELMGRIYQNEVYQISSRNTSATWFYIQPAGWVSNTVVFTIGDCTNIPVNDAAIGVGFADETGFIDTDAAAILERFPCPADFSGYMQTRIVIGAGTAQVEAGTIPNTIRAFPSVDDAEAPRLGTIQPSRVLDRVISGPVCNQGFVWWLVEIDGVVGWTAESNQPSNDYYLEPTGDAPAPETSRETIDVSGTAITELIYNVNGSRLFALTSTQGFGDGSLGVVIVFNGASGDSQARVEEPTGIVDIDYAVGADDILIAAGNGTVTLYNTETLEQIAQLTALFTVAEQVHVEVMPDSSFIIVAECTDDSCSASQISTIDANTGEVLAGTPIDSAVIAMTISDDGQTLAVVSEDGVSFHVPNTLALSSQWDNSDAFELDSVALKQDGSSALFAGCNNTECSQGRIGLLDVSDASLLGIVPSHTAEATLISYNLDYTRFVTVAAESGEVIERSASTGEETQRFSVEVPSTVTSLAYTPDGEAIALGLSNGQVVFQTLTN